MRKRNKRNAVYVESGGWMGKGLVAAAVAAVFTVSLGWWLFASPSESRLKKTCLTRLSVMVDRFDQLSEAWKNRGVHGMNDSRKKKSVVTEQDRVHATSPRTETSPAPPAPEPAAETAAGDTASPAPPVVLEKPKSDVSQRDKDALTKLLSKEPPVKREPKPTPVAAEHKTPPPPAPEPAREAPPTREVPKEDQDALRDLLKNLD